MRFMVLSAQKLQTSRGHHGPQECHPGSVQFGDGLGAEQFGCSLGDRVFSACLCSSRERYGLGSGFFLKAVPVVPVLLLVAGKRFRLFLFPIPVWFLRHPAVII